MGIEKVILLVIKIFTWFYQKWLSKFQITSANKIELWQIKKNIQHSASALVFGQKLNIFQSSAFSFSQMWKCNFGHSLLQALEYTIQYTHAIITHGCSFSMRFYEWHPDFGLKVS